VGLALAAASPAAAPAAAPGINVELHDFEHGSAGVVRGTGARWQRVFLWWSAMQPTRGTVDERLLAAYQRGARAAAARKLKLIVVVLGTPAWASTDGRVNGPPARPADYAAFIRTVAARLRPNVAAYEIWNEPDIEKFWGGPPDAAAYARLLRAAHPAVKSADRNAKVVFGPLTGNDFGFLAGAYRAGARGHFDAVGVHTDIPCHIEPPEHYIRDPDGSVSRWSFLGYRSVRRTMLRHGDRKPIWMTELGWAASAVPCPVGVWAGQKLAGVTEAQQAANLRRAYACLARDRYVQVALWFTLRDTDPVEGNAGRYGFFRLDGTLRPAWESFRSVVADPPRPRSCRPRYGGPHVSARVLRGPHTRAVDIRATVRARLRVARILFRLDGHTFRRLQGHRTSAVVRVPAARLRAGRRHVVTVVASDTAHNGGKATVVVRGR
jgi:polysaccharide biosynthesis protein PslG